MGIILLMAAAVAGYFIVENDKAAPTVTGGATTVTTTPVGLTGPPEPIITPPLVPAGGASMGAPPQPTHIIASYGYVPYQAEVDDNTGRLMSTL